MTKASAKPTTYLNITKIGVHESVERAAQLLTKDIFLVVEDEMGKPVGVVTRMDLIDFFA